MTRDLYLHIGTHKTGTTSLQRFFSQNREILKKQGIVYPDTRIDPYAHHALGWSFNIETEIVPNAILNKLKSFEKEWSIIYQAAGDKVLVSSETLLSLSQEQMFQVREITRDFNVKIVIYLRRQDEMAASVLNELIKRGRWTKTCSGEIPYQLDYFKIITVWKDVFGIKNIIVRPFEDLQFYKKSIFADFSYHILGIELNDDMLIPSTNLNPRLSRDLLEYKRLLNHYPVEWQDSHDIIRFLVHYSEKQKQSEHEMCFKKELLSPHEKLEFCRRYEKSNSIIAREYLARKDGRLFYNPLPELNEDWRSYSGIPEGKLIEMTSEMKDYNYRLFELLKEKVQDGLHSMDESLKITSNILGIAFKDPIADSAGLIKSDSIQITQSDLNHTEQHYYEHTGYCPVCTMQTTFKSTDEWLRDHYYCELCHSIPRERALHLALTKCFPGWEKRQIYESSPSNTRIADKVENYSPSQYYPNKQLGVQHEGFRNENLEKLTFPDKSTDVFITLDVLEHVFNPQKVIEEMYRVIRPGGVVAYTVPVYKDLAYTRQRAALKSDGTIEYLLEPVYHGNPVGDGRSLVTWDYGQDYLKLLSSWTRGRIVHVNEVHPEYGIEGEFLDVFIVFKE